jgi:hypothetical protein
MDWTKEKEKEAITSKDICCGTILGNVSKKAASNGDSVPVMSQSLRHEVFEHNIILTVDISDVGDDLLFWEGGSIVIISYHHCAYLCSLERLPTSYHF